MDELSCDLDFQLSNSDVQVLNKSHTGEPFDSWLVIPQHNEFLPAITG